MTGAPLDPRRPIHSRAAVLEVAVAPRRVARPERAVDSSKVPVVSCRSPMTF